MNSKVPVLIMLLVVLFSCKREIVCLETPVLSIEPLTARQYSENSEAPMASAMEAEEKVVNNLNSKAKKHLKKKRSVSEKKEKNTDQITENKIVPKIKEKKKIENKDKVKKEINPRLSRALVMTIIGGVAVALGVIFINVAPTGLFIFAFGIVFLAGLISLIMYLANPRPKM